MNTQIKLNAFEEAIKRFRKSPSPKAFRKIINIRSNIYRSGIEWENIGRWEELSVQEERLIKQYRKMFEDSAAYFVT